MIREEAINKWVIPAIKNTWNEKTCDEIIEALVREPVLDKIRAEIESQRQEASDKHSEDAQLQAFYDGLNDGLKDARDIIDGYEAAIWATSLIEWACAKRTILEAECEGEK